MVDIDLVKQSINVIGDDQDLLIQQHIDAAVVFVQGHIDRVILEQPPVGDIEENQVLLDAGLKQAIMQLAGFFFLNRENQSFGGYGAQAVSVVDRVLLPYKRF